MSEHVVKINGGQYRYRYNPDTQATEYLGPVGDAPELGEAEFLAAMMEKKLTPKQKEMVKLMEDGWVLSVSHVEKTTHARLYLRPQYDEQEGHIKDYLGLWGPVKGYDGKVNMSTRVFNSLTKDGIIEKEKTIGKGNLQSDIYKLV